MSIFSTIKGWLTMLFRSKAKEEFQIEPIGSEEMFKWINMCLDTYRGNPPWLSEKDHIDTVNFAKALCSETARLATMGIGIRIDGSARAEWLKGQIESIYFQLRNWMEYSCAYGTVILKPNGTQVQLYTPAEFEITHHTDGRIDGVVFHNWKKVGNNWHTRLECHRTDNGIYTISNKCYIGTKPDDTQKEIAIEQTPWADIAPESHITNMTGTLYGVLRMPQANNIDMDSPYGLPIFSEAIQELRDLDIAYSRNASEIFDSKRIVLADDSLITSAGEKIQRGTLANQYRAEHLGLPDMVKMVRGDGRENYYQEINPELNTEMRLKGLNALLNQIGYKAGYSNGHFVFNERGGIATATQVEADQQRTIQLIKDVRDKLEDCISNLIYALNAFADLYGYAPSGAYEVVFDFGDITYNREEDRARWWGYVVNGKVPAWRYFVKFEGMTEEDAKAMIAEAAPQRPKLFETEE